MACSDRAQSARAASASPVPTNRTRAIGIQEPQHLPVVGEEQQRLGLVEEYLGAPRIAGFADPIRGDLQDVAEHSRRAGCSCGGDRGFECRRALRPLAGLPQSVAPIGERDDPGALVGSRQELRGLGCGRGGRDAGHRSGSRERQQAAGTCRNLGAGGRRRALDQHAALARLMVPEKPEASDDAGRSSTSPPSRPQSIAAR